MKTHSSFLKTTLSIAISWISAAAFAAESTGRLEEVIVTAQKRDESVQEIPASVVALSSQMLDTRGIRDITDLQAHVPSMSVGQTYGANMITLRGISTGLTSGTEDPSVAVHVNGVYQARSRSLDIAMMDLERVEVLAGPQGTLYGRNATGGVVNYIAAAPSSTYEGNLSVGAGNYRTSSVEGFVSGPITDQLGFRLSGLYNDQDKGFTKNLYEQAPKRYLEDKHVVGGRLAFSYLPVDTLQLNLDMMYVDSKTSTLLAPVRPSINPDSPTNFFPQTIEPHKFYSELDPKLDSIYQQASLTVNWQVADNVQFKSISSYQKYDDRMDIDQDGMSIDAVSIFQDSWSETFTQEFNLTTQMLDGDLDSIYGVFYFDDTMNAVARVHFFVDPTFFPPESRAYLLPQTFQDSKSISAFTDQTYHLTERTRLIAGIRYNKDEKDGRLCFGLLDPPCEPVAESLSWNAWTPKFGVQHDISENVMVYIQYQKGFKSGGFVANSGGDSYDPEYIKGTEVGVKSTLWDQRIRLNAAAWHYKYDDLQVQQNRGIGIFDVNNAAASTLKGLELSIQAQLTPNLKIDLATMVQSSKYDSFISCNQTVAVGACTTAENTVQSDLSGNRLNRAPPYTANLGLEYSFEMPYGGELLVRGESYWSGAVHFDEFNTSGIRQDAYSVQNGFIVYTPASGRYKLNAFVKNIADKEYLISGFYASAMAQLTGNWAPPRTYGAELSINF